MKMIILSIVVSSCQKMDTVKFYLDEGKTFAESSKACVLDLSKCASAKTNEAFAQCYERKLSIQIKRLFQ